MSSTVTQTSHVWRRFITPAEAKDYNNVRTALEQMVTTEKTVELVEKDFDFNLYITAKTRIELASSLEELKRGLSVPITVSNPIPIYMESINAIATDKMVKSANGHNRFYYKAEQFEEILLAGIENGQLPRTDMLDASKCWRLVADKCEIREDWIKKIILLGPNGYGPNALVDDSKGIGCLPEIRESLDTGFQTSISRGPLAGEPIRGLRLSLVDFALYGDSSRRDSAQVIGMITMAVQSAIANAGPTILEPWYFVEFLIPDTVFNDVLSSFSSRRGDAQTMDTEGTSTKVAGTLPVAEADDFQAYLLTKSKDSGMTCQFFGYMTIPGDVEDGKTLAGAIRAVICDAKGLELKSLDELRSNSKAP